MSSAPEVLHEHDSGSWLRTSIINSNGGIESEYFVFRELPPLTDLYMQRHAILTRYDTPSSDSIIRQWAETVSEEAYPSNPDTIPATYPEEWLQAELARLRSPSLALPADDWVATTAETRARMNVTSAGNMEVLAQALRTLPERCVLNGTYDEKWKEALRQAVMRNNDAGNSQ